MVFADDPFPRLLQLNLYRRTGSQALPERAIRAELVDHLAYESIARQAITVELRNSASAKAPKGDFAEMLMAGHIIPITPRHLDSTFGEGELRPYSSRSATSGSTRVARHAGT